MRYTTEEGGRLNNFAVEPKMYTAEAPSTTERRNYLFLGVGALVLLSGVLFIAVSVS